MRNSSAAMLTKAAILCTLTTLGGGMAWAQNQAPDTVTAPAGAIHITLPYNKAIVRESVPIILRDFPDGGYVSVSIDNQFVTAQGLPVKRKGPVYIWDTKAAYTLASNPGVSSHYADGSHTVTISVFDAQNKLVGKDSVAVQLSNKINLPASQGITLAYPWKANLSLRYQRRTTLTAVPTDGSDSEQTVQQSLLRYRRTVENTTGGTYLIRDEVLPVDKSVRPIPFVSYVTTRGVTTPLQNGFDIRARYRVVDTRGRILSEVGTHNGGDQIGFSLPILPPRRVSVGAHWESPVQIALDWTSPYPTTVMATSTLEDFEWQDRYPTAKIRETYTGPVNFNPGPGSPLPPIQSQNIKFERVIFFAYNAGRVVRTETTLTLSTVTPGLLVNSAVAGGGFPGSSSYPGGSMGGQSAYGPGAIGGAGQFGGDPRYNPMGQPGKNQGGPGRPRGNPSSTRQFPGSSSPGAGFPGGGYPGGGFPGGGGIPGGGFPGAGFPGAGFPGQGGAGAVDPVPVKLKYTETSVILI